MVVHQLISLALNSGKFLHVNFILVMILLIRLGLRILLDEKAVIWLFSDATVINKMRFSLFWMGLRNYNLFSKLRVDDEVVFSPLRVHALSTLLGRFLFCNTLRIVSLRPSDKLVFNLGVNEIFLASSSRIL